MNLQKQIKRLHLIYQDVRKRFPGHRPRIFYVVPEANWSIDWDGHYITDGVRSQFPVQAKISRDSRWLSGQIVHYGSLWSYLGNQGHPQNARNKIVVTVFHGNRTGNDKNLSEGIEKLLVGQDEIDHLVVSNSIMQARFIEWGIAASKLSSIPLGVDLSLFKAASQVEKLAMRKKLGIAGDAFCVGSFQKDGEGWEEGLTPKLVKGPDLFADAIEMLSKQHKMHVVLTGPARGYVKKRLDQAKVPFTHVQLDNYEEIVPYYQALDAYMVSSREEGGPKGVLESLACGIPLVTSRVGLAPDVITDGENGLLVANGEATELAKAMERVILEPNLRDSLRVNGLESIQAYDWTKIAATYYREVYKQLIDRSGAG
jgi:glycosyltransferase involved in cell wall biosynthesis